jgi:LacI family transcriptional regulator
LELGQWLFSLANPTGIIACNDVRGAQLLNVCRAKGIRVPDDLAVIGVDNDELICELATPPLSSVVVDAYRTGYVASELLDRMLSGERVADTRLLVDPIGVVSRQSTDIFAIDDPEVGEALRYIRNHACQGIAVSDVARAVHMSRSTLARRFASLTGTTVKAELTRLRIDRIKQLLVDTEYPLAAIARMTGFAHAEYMSTLFKEVTDETPGQYRKKAKQARHPAPPT